jgi:hypothetical protein
MPARHPIAAAKRNLPSPVGDRVFQRARHPRPLPGR